MPVPGPVRSRTVRTTRTTGPPPVRPGRSGRPAHGPATVAGVAAGLGVLAQIAHPLLSGGPLRAATIVSVLFLALAAIAHAKTDWGRRGAATVLAVAGGLGLAVETLGVHTGLPFGTYSYADSLGPRLLGVPLLVPLAWTMLAYPSLLLGRRLARHTGAGPAAERVLTAATGGLALAGWDLFLDPQMVGEGHWSWAHPAPGLPGVPGIPLTNYAGWLVVSLVMVAALDRLLPSAPGAPSDRAGGSDRAVGELVPAAVLAWTWAGSAVGNLVFFDRPWVALYGGLAMGLVVVPYLHLLLGRPPRRSGRSAARPSAAGRSAAGRSAAGQSATGHETWRSA